VAWVVGDYDFVEDSTTEGVVVRCYTPVGKAEQGRFALHVGTRALSFFSTIFGAYIFIPSQVLGETWTDLADELGHIRSSLPLAQAGHDRDH